MLCELEFLVCLLITVDHNNAGSHQSTVRSAISSLEYFESRTEESLILGRFIYYKMVLVTDKHRFDKNAMTKENCGIVKSER